MHFSEELRKAKILITGGTGLVGSYVIRTLLKYDFINIHAIARSSSKYDLLPGVKDRVSWHHTDVNDVVGLHDALFETDYVIHCAALVSFDSRDKRQLVKTNVEGTANIVNLSLEHKVRKLIHISSIAALGRNTANGITDENTEWVDNSNNSFYSLTKYLGEMEVWRGQAEGLDVAVLIPGLILGSGYWNVGTNGFFNHVWKESKFYPTGATGFVDVRDLAEFACRMIGYEGVEKKFITIGHNASYRHFLSLIAGGLNKKEPSIKTNKFILESAWRLDKLRSVITGSRPMLTKETAKTSSKNYIFDNKRSLAIDNFSYRPLETTIAEIAAQFKAVSAHKFPPSVLNL